MKMLSQPRIQNLDGFQQFGMFGCDAGAFHFGTSTLWKTQLAGYQSLGFRKIKFNKALIFY